MTSRRQFLAGAAATGAFLLVSSPESLFATPETPRQTVGADVPWTSYPAHEMKTNGAVLGPKYAPFLIEMESSRQSCVKLSAEGEYVEFTVKSRANAMVVRYSLPDSADGAGLNSTFDLYRNGKLLRTVPITSKYSWLYGEYPFCNDPTAGKPRNFYDEVRLKGIEFAKGDVIRLQKAASDAPYLIIDLVDLEDIAPPLQRPANSVSFLEFGADGHGKTDDTEALRKCLAEAARSRKIAWVPAGDYKLTGDIEVPSNVTLQGAGMWHTTFVGDDEVYRRPDRRLRFKLTGKNSHLADFALIGKLNYRNDDEQNDGIFGSLGKDCTISRLWIEHTKVGMWFYVCQNIVIDGCRLRNTLADGINFCVDVRDSAIQNCTARNTGDDCFAIWPAASDQGHTQQTALPGNNVIRRCTGQTPFLANGAAIYGGANNRIEDCLFTDIASGCGILLSSTFPTSDEKLGIDNNFSGTTVVRNCELVRCGGFDHGWTWRAAVQVCLHRRNISGLRLSDLRIKDSLSDGFSVIAPGSPNGQGTLSDARLDHVDIPNCGVGLQGRHGLWVHEDVRGGLTISNSRIADVRNNSKNFQISSL
ncbi:MAG TPA: glycosyl hydrolase family 28-related protein [Candidatus Acidoferrales bacterium]|nr:glycosyl hydrolase family 28-related protein [Candidatus Acidoferrales bacterium]